MAQGSLCPYCVTKGIKKAASLFSPHGKWRNAVMVGIWNCHGKGAICVLPSLGVWLSRCCAYQGSFRKSSKSVVNSLFISAKVPVFQGFSEIIKVVYWILISAIVMAVMAIIKLSKVVQNGTRHEIIAYYQNSYYTNYSNNLRINTFVTIYYSIPAVRQLLSV